MDPAARLGLETLARRLAETAVNVVWVTHDLEQLHRLADHVLILIGGRVAHSGPAVTLESDCPPDVRRFLAAVAVDDEVGER